MLKVKGLQIKQRVKRGELRIEDAKRELARVKGGSESKTYQWLVRKGEQDAAR